MKGERGKIIAFATVLILSAFACEAISGSRYDIPQEEANSVSDTETLMETCAAEPDQYDWEFANVNYEHSNETKKVCQGDFTIWNTSNEVLYYKWYKIWDNGAMQDIGWEESHQRLGPGDEFSIAFETQTWPESGESTMTTYTNLIVFRAAPECAALLEDGKYEELWDKIAEPLIDPCR